MRCNSIGLEFHTPGGMVGFMLVIEGRVAGQRRRLFEGFSVPPPGDVADGGEPLKLRALIAYVVQNEVALFQQRREARRLDRVLSPRQISRGESRGRVAPEGRPRAKDEKPVDSDAAVEAALQAFGDGLYLVVIDGDEYRDLDQIVKLTPDSRLTFIRLIFLAGA